MELKSLTLNGTTYDSFQNKSAVKSVNGITPDENGNVEIKIPEGSGGVSDYPELTNKPKINGVEVAGDKTSADYGIGNPTDEQVATAVESYLDAHPEATTAVADGSVTPNKTSFLKQYKLNLYDASKVTAGRFDNASDTNYMTSDYIPVKKAVYAVSTRPWYAELYKDGVVVKNFSPSTTTIDLTQYDVEFNQIRLATYGSSVPGNMMFSEGTLPDSYISYDSPENIKTDITDDSVKKCFGDSAYEHVKNQGVAGLIKEHSLPANRLDFGVNHACNLCDFSKASEGYVGSNGTLAGSAVYTTDFISVEEGATYYGLGTFMSGLYDADKNFIRNFTPCTDFVDGGYTIPAGEGVAYIRSSGVGKNTVITKGFKASGYIAPTPSFRMLDDYARVDIRAYLLGTYGQRWFAVGDSITSGYGATTNYVNVICQNWLYGGTNYGIPGTQLTSTSGNGDGMCERIKTYDETKCDIITVCGGINDKNNGVTIGTIDDTDTTTVYGALKDICNTFLTKYSGKRCGFITPLKYTAGETSNVTKAIKEVAAYYNIPVLDMESEFGYLFNYTDDVKNAYTVDGLHPNAAGQALMARKIASWLLTL